MVQDSEERCQQEPAAMTSQNLSPRQCLAERLAMEELSHPRRNASQVDSLSLSIGFVAELFQLFYGDLEGRIRKKLRTGKHSRIWTEIVGEDVAPCCPSL